MPKITLNDRSIRRAQPETGRVELFDTIVPGFGLRITSGGSRTYFAMGRVGRKLVRRTIGSAPPPHVSRDAPLAPGEFWAHEAREAARLLLADFERGIDPGVLQKPTMVAAAPEPVEPVVDTFKRVADAYLADKLKGGGATLKTRTELERKLKADLKVWDDRAIIDIRGKDIRELVRTKAQTSPISANRLLSFIKRVFRWAASQDYIDADPAASVQKPSEEKPRQRYLDEREIRLVWAACDKIGDPYGRLCKLLLLTGQRRGEVAGMLRSELGKLQYTTPDPTTGKPTTAERRAWLLPASRTKRSKPHAVPLSTLAIDLIDEAPKLASINGELFDHLLAAGDRGDQAVSGWSKYRARLDELVGQEIAKEARETYDPQRHTLAAWHLHDLRATVATMLESRLEIPTRVVSRILNHAEGDGRSMTARYVRHSWDREAADALDLWADLLGRIVGLNVVELGVAANK